MAARCDGAGRCEWGSTTQDCSPGKCTGALNLCDQCPPGSQARVRLRRISRSGRLCPTAQRITPAWRVISTRTCHRMRPSYRTFVDAFRLLREPH
jgi:hypothetical protein